MAPIAYIRCPQCNTVIEKPAAGTPVCPGCGFGATPAKKPTKTAAKGAKASEGAAAPVAAPPPGTWAAAPPLAPPPTMPPVGAPSHFTDPGAPAPVTSGKAIAAMVVGIVACCLPLAIPVVGPFLALAAGIVALVLGVIANRECTREPQRLKGKGMAITGIVLGSIMIVLGILGLLVLFVFLDAFEEAICEDDPESEECQRFRDAFAEAGPGPMAALGMPRVATPWLAAAGRLAMPA